MSTHEEKSHISDDSNPLELNKETLQNLDVEPADAGEVKGGASYIYYNAGSIYYGASKVALSLTTKPPPPPPGGASISGVSY